MERQLNGFMENGLVDGLVGEVANTMPGFEKFFGGNMWTIHFHFRAYQIGHVAAGVPLL